jgi:hypothetical protein
VLFRSTLHGFAFPCIRLALFSAGFLAAPSFAGSASRPEFPWYLGHFTGRVATAPGRAMVLSLDCAPDRCQLEVTLEPAAPGSHPERPGPLAPTLRGLDVANGNLARTRRAVADDPELYDDAQDGVPLSAARDLVASEATFSDCVDISSVAPTYFLLCATTADPKAVAGAWLLMSTMAPACVNGRPFCAYYYVPLRRQSGTGGL